MSRNSALWGVVKAMSCGVRELADLAGKAGVPATAIEEGRTRPR